MIDECMVRLVVIVNSSDRLYTSYVLCSFWITTYVMNCVPSGSLLALFCVPSIHYLCYYLWSFKVITYVILSFVHYAHVGMNLATHPKGLDKGLLIEYFYTHPFLFHVFQVRQRTYWRMMSGTHDRVIWG